MHSTTSSGFLCLIHILTLCSSGVGPFFPPCSFSSGTHCRVFNFQLIACDFSCITLLPASPGLLSAACCIYPLQPCTCPKRSSSCPCGQSLKLTARSVTGTCPARHSGGCSWQPLLPCSLLPVFIYSVSLLFACILSLFSQILLSSFRFLFTFCQDYYSIFLFLVSNPFQVCS